MVKVRIHKLQVYQIYESDAVIPQKEILYYSEGEVRNAENGKCDNEEADLM
jgi:hypothetical protein